MRYLFFIPARGGSKGIHRKNLKIIGGKPLLYYTISETLKISELDSLFLSSDDYEILSYGSSLGLSVDYKRPANLSDDASQVVDAIIDALDWLEIQKKYYDAVVVLQPTSPLRTSEDIKDAINLFEKSGATTLVGVHKVEEHPFENIKTSNGGWAYCEKSDKNINRRQDYPNAYYHINGAIYIATTNFIKANKSLVDEGKSSIFIMPKERGFDLDEKHQIPFLEWLLTK